jgi:hypothetical protein
MMPIQISTKLTKLEEAIGRLKYQYGYSAIVLLKKDGSRWYRDRFGQLISEKNIDPDLLPSTCIVLPECLEIENNR